MAERPTTDGRSRAGSLLAGRYHLERPIGRGGTGGVWKAEDTRLGRPVAVKILHPHAAAEPPARRRFEMEAGAAARLNHPNIVAVHDYGEDDDTAFIVMECLPGTTLADVLRDGPLSRDDVVDLALQALAALDHAHGHGILHRDVKAANLLRAVDGRWKVADFGIAKAMGATVDLTGTGLLVGTPAYLAPERIEGAPATVASDLYSLGVVLYEAATGVRPFSGPDAMSTVKAVCAGVYRPVLELAPDLGSGSAAVIEEALCRDPSDRPADAAGMARRVEQAARPMTTLPAPAARGQTQVLPALGSAALGSAALGSAALGSAALGSAALGSAAIGPVSEAPPTLASPSVAAAAPTLETGVPPSGPPGERRPPAGRRWLSAAVLVCLLAILVGLRLGGGPAAAHRRAGPAPGVTVARLLPPAPTTTTTLFVQVPAPAPAPAGKHHGKHPGK